MTKNEFIKKYYEAVKTLSKERDVDMGVAMDMLIANARNRDKSTEELSDESYYYRFEGYKKLDYKELDEDIKVLEDNGVIPKLV